MSQNILSNPGYSAAPTRPLEPEIDLLARVRAFVTIYNGELCIALCILVVGVALRLAPHPTPHRRSLDEYLYINVVRQLQAVGIGEYPAIVQEYVKVQSKMQSVMLPPTRCLFVICAYGWASVFHTEPGAALDAVAALFSILGFLIAGVCAARMGGAKLGLAVSALMAVAPVELQMAHCALVDGFFACWAVLAFWLLWENLQKPGRPGVLLAYIAAIAAMVLTKENSFFAFVGLCGILALARPLKLGVVSRQTILATLAAPLLGLAILIFISGSLGTFIETYRLLVTKAEQMGFAYATGGGPWFRYIADLFLMSPGVLLPAIGAVFALRRENKPAIFLLLFVVFSYAVMTNVRNGMNLRYATMWDMPLRYLAATQLLVLSSHVRRAPRLAMTGLVIAVCLLDLRQYYTFFILHDVPEPVTIYLMRALDIVRQAKG